MMKRALICLTVFALVSTAVPQIFGEPQSKGTASLSGVVIGPDDKPVPHASVTYQSSDGTAPHAVHADSHGHFTITKLKSGNYDLRASANGIFSDWEKNVMVRKGQAHSLELHLIYAKEMPKSVSDKKPKQ
ncbi:MAG TPA: carboxypeptidase-like regulatory domain-containing protein [Candidatus Methylomirabilis sp.]|nr:carboxypeptidase-like regulatory domain-containing protein [Candidatus Methylomirabilis sp.]